MTIHPFPSGPLETNAYLIVCPTTQKTAIVDPSPGSADLIIPFIESSKIQPEKILLTHSHWDHIADVAKLKSRYKIPVYIHKADVDNLQNPGADQLPCWIEIEPTTADFFFTEGDKLNVGNLIFEVIHTPGHSPGSVCFYCPEQGLLLSGDTLFKGSMGKISFPTSLPHLMWDSLKKLSNLPPNTIVYPGHGPVTKIGAEKWLSRAEEYFGTSVDDF